MNDSKDADGFGGDIVAAHYNLQYWRKDNDADDNVNHDAVDMLMSMMVMMIMMMIKHPDHVNDLTEWGGAPCAQANRAIPCTSEPKSRAHTMRLPARALGKFQEELNNVASQASCKFQRSTERQCKNGLVEIATNKKVTTCPPPHAQTSPNPRYPPPQGRES